MIKALERKTTGLLVIDVQERLFPEVDRAPEVIRSIKKVVEGFQILQIPIVLTEQYPQGLGPTVSSLNQLLQGTTPLIKTTFSCLGDLAIRDKLLAMPIKQWVLVGIEAHVCVLQTARDLLQAGCQVVVLNDAIASRFKDDFSVAISELKSIGARVSTSETVLFELLKDSKALEFKKISQLIKTSIHTETPSGSLPKLPENSEFGYKI